MGDNFFFTHAKPRLGSGRGASRWQWKPLPAALLDTSVQVPHAVLPLAHSPTTPIAPTRALPRPLTRSDGHARSLLIWDAKLIRQRCAWGATETLTSGLDSIQSAGRRTTWPLRPPIGHAASGPEREQIEAWIGFTLHYIRYDSIWKQNWPGPQLTGSRQHVAIRKLQVSFPSLPPSLPPSHPFPPLPWATSGLVVTLNTLEAWLEEAGSTGLLCFLLF